MHMKYSIAYIILLLSLTAVQAQDQAFKASAPARVNAGQQFQYTIEGAERGEVQLPPLSEFQLLGGPFSSFSSSTQYINGKRTQTTVVSWTYVFRASQEGSFRIPPATVKVGRKEFQTNEVEINVMPGDAGMADPGTPPADGATDPAMQAQSSEADVFLRIQPSRKEVYVGEQLVSGLRVYTRVNTRPTGTAKDVPYEGFYKITIDPDPSAQRTEINGQTYVNQVIQRHILIPQKTGEIEIPPYESEWFVQKRVQRQRRSVFDDFFSDPFFDSYQDVPLTLSTRPLQIRVKALPPGAPEGFTGAVGDFEVEATLSADELKVNEALSLKVTIRGTGNLPLLSEPEVHLPPDHDLYDVNRTLNTSTTGNRLSGSVQFDYPIVVRHAGRFRIAPIRFSWFDPRSEEYREVVTEEFNFTVLKGEEEESLGARIYAPGVSQESVRDLGTDIRDISRLPLLSRPVNFTLMAQPWYLWFYAAALLVVLALILLIRMVARRNADLSLVRNRKASKMARNRFKKADRFRKAGKEDAFYEELAKACWGYLSDKLNIPTAELGRDMILEELQGRDVSEELRIQLVEILENSEFSRFAPSSERSDMDQLYKQAVALIKKLESSLK